ncbi:Lrp/AsnC family transcriptional regulator [Candidatus Woesearchaeota archaeon]|nr:Lrp/AsnC family transcriptional regulator [Candidatus Woesearchaeota archaeon]
MTYELDNIDKRIIEVLQEHGEYTTRKIAKKLLLPTTTVYNRVKRLKKEQIIKNFTINLDHKKIGRNFVVYVLISVNLPLLKQKKKSQYDLMNEMKRFSFVEHVDIVSGTVDMICIIRVHDVEEFDEVITQKIQMLEGVNRTQSLIAIHSS